MGTGATPDKKTVIRELIEQGKAKGQLSTKEILDALGELDFEPEQIEKFYDTLEAQLPPTKIWNPASAPRALRLTTL